jgi:hypothetical protein
VRGGAYFLTTAIDSASAGSVDAGVMQLRLAGPGLWRIRIDRNSINDVTNVKKQSDNKYN